MVAADVALESAERHSRGPNTFHIGRMRLRKDCRHDKRGSLIGYVCFPEDRKMGMT